MSSQPKDDTGPVKWTTERAEQLASYMDELVESDTLQPEHQRGFDEVARVLRAIAADRAALQSDLDNQHDLKLRAIARAEKAEAERDELMDDRTTTVVAALRDEYTKDCKCHAYSRGECACGALWPEDVAREAANIIIEQARLIAEGGYALDAEGEC